MQSWLLKTVVYLFLLAVTPSLAIAQKREMSPEHREVLAAMLDSVPRVTPTRLDFSNPLHWQFYLGQLANAGVTPKTNPQFFRVLKQAKADHERFGPAALAASSPEQPVHVITSLGAAQSNSKNYHSSALASIPGKPPHSLMTLALHDATTNHLIGTAKQAQGNPQSENLNLAATGTLPDIAHDVKAVATYSWVDTHGTPYHYVSHALASEAEPTQMTCDAPKPKTGQTVTKICLGRSLGDCTYDPAQGSGGNIPVPFKGSITFGADINQSQPMNAYVALANTDSGAGGGCTIATSTEFFQNAKTKISGKTLSWDLTTFFQNQGCLKPNSNAIFTFTVNLTAGQSEAYAAITNSPRSSPSNNTLKIPATWVYWSCLATGSRISMANGTLKNIEDLEPGDLIISDMDHRIQVVDSILVGTEEKPILRLRTDKGHDLRVTEGHPMVTPDGVTLAYLLEVGDSLLTLSGEAELVSISEERYDGQVWNLNIGPPPESFEAFRDDTTFFANGVLVGDNQMQFAHNRKHQANPLSVLEALPVEWHEDYLNYINRVAAKGYLD